MNKSSMISRTVVLTAGLVYALVVGCVLWTSSAQDRSNANGADANGPSATGARRVAQLPYRGVGMQIQRVDWMDRYKQSLDEIVAVGADTVLFVVDARQENGTSTKIYLDMRHTPTPEQLADLIQSAKKKGLRVVLMPIVLLDNPRGDEWRGTLKPHVWEEWFDSYRDMIMQFAWIAEGNGVDVLVIGSELVSSETKLREWTRTINVVREIFKGQITYSANWDKYADIPFWDQLDLLGLNSYYTLGNDHHVTVEQIKASWKKIQVDLFDFQRKQGKPLIFTEVGWCSMQNAAKDPWDYTQPVPIDLDLQKRLYEAFFQSWHGQSAMGGFMVWEWPPGEGGPEDKSYTPKNKPAMEVLKQWLAKPAWEVLVK